MEYREISFQQRVVNECELASKNHMQKLVNEVSNDKFDYFIQMPTASGKTTVVQLSALKYLNDDPDNRAVIIFTLSRAGLVDTMLNVFQKPDNPLIQVADITEIKSLREMYAKTVYVIGWDSVNRENNIITFKKLYDIIFAANLKGISFRCYFDECHLNTENINTLHTFPINEFVHLSATLPAEAFNNIGYYSVVDKSEAIKEGLLVSGRIYYNLSRYMDEARKALLGEDKNSVLRVFRAVTDFMSDACTSIDTLRKVNITHNGKLVYFKYPCLVFTLPNEESEKSEVDINLTVENVVDILINKFGVHEDEIAIYLADNKTNIGDLKDNDTVHYIITKEAISVGWDCPRCISVCKLRGLSTWSATIQEIGRILRSYLGYDITDLDNYEELIKDKDINTALDLLNHPYIFTNDEELIPQLKSYYEKEIAVANDNIKRCEGDLNEVTEVMEEISKFEFDFVNTRDVTSITKRKNEYEIYIQANSFITCMQSALSTCSHSLQIMESKTAHKQKISDSNIECLRLNGFKFDNFDTYISTVIDEIADLKDFEEENLEVEDKDIERVYLYHDLKTKYATFGKLLNLSCADVFKFLSYVFEVEKMGYGDMKLLCLPHIQFNAFIYNNYELLESWFAFFKKYGKSKYLKDDKIELEEKTEIFRLKSEHLRPYCLNTDSSLESIAENLLNYVKDNYTCLNYIYKDVPSVHFMNKRGKIIENEYVLEKEIFNSKANKYFRYFKNGDKHLPNFSVPYEMVMKYKFPKGAVCSENGKHRGKINFSKKQNFYPDYVGFYQDEEEKVIYLCISELKDKFEKNGKHNYVEEDLKEKFKALCTFVKNYKHSSYKGYTFKVSACILRRIPFNNQFCLLNCDEKNVLNIYKQNKSWQQISNLDEYIKCMKANAR